MPVPLATHAAETLRLAWPVAVARMGVLTMALVNTMVVGRYATRELAFQALGFAPTNALVVSLVGLLTGTLVMTAQGYGSGNRPECGAVWRRSLPYALGLGGIAGAACLLGEPFLRWTGQSPEMAAGGGRVMLILGLGLPFHALYTSSAYFLEGIQRPLPSMVAMVLANLANLALCLLLVFGGFGLAPLGAVGSALATTLTRAGLAIGLGAYIWTMRDAGALGVRQPAAGGWAGGRLQRRLGYAAGLSAGMETSAFSALSIFAGLMGELALGGFAIALNVLSLAFMMALGLGSATAVRVGAFTGRGDGPGARTAGWTGFGLNSAIMAVAGLIMTLAAAPIAGVYTDDPALAAVAAPLIGLAAWIVVADGGQGVMALALRGRGDTWVPPMLHLVSYMGVMLPGSWLLGMTAGHGARGLLEATLIASLVSVTFCAARFFALTRRLGAPQAQAAR